LRNYFLYQYEVNFLCLLCHILFWSLLCQIWVLLLLLALEFHLLKIPFSILSLSSCIGLW
jgi:hypothetical protein